jgi:hypothetical protein
VLDQEKNEINKKTIKAAAPPPNNNQKKRSKYYNNVPNLNPQLHDLVGTTATEEAINQK